MPSPTPAPHGIGHVPTWLWVTDLVWVALLAPGIQMIGLGIGQSCDNCRSARLGVGLMGTVAVFGTVGLLVTLATRRPRRLALVVAVAYVPATLLGIVAGLAVAR
ncbi:MAG TPA: hypothetical protein VNA20_08550 [Frankiaceae bacterium]|nr:hypothetical protein [Frankiaceae bacterium]